MNPGKIAVFLAQIRLFRNLDEKELITVARRFEEVSLQSGEILFREGTPGGDFYIITSGEIYLARGSGDQEVEVGLLKTHDYFGEESYLRKKGHSATASANKETKLLVMKADAFGQFLREYPDIKEELEILATSYEIGRSKNFDWLGEDEIIHMITKKHYYVLLGSIAPLIPFIVLGLILISRGFTVADDLRGLLIAFFGIMFAVPLTLLALWRWLDWTNDYYILTDERVVWIERIVLLYSSRNVVPLDAVLSVNVNTRFWQRFWKSGDVVVNTFTGRMVMQNVALPEQFAAMIKDYWHRLQERASEEEYHTRVQVIRETFDLETQAEELPIEEFYDESQRGYQKDEPNLFQQMMNFIKTRYEDKGTVTYRKHWFLLLAHSWKSIFFLTATTIVLLIFFFRPINFGAEITVLISLANVVATGFFLYNLLDWANDIYRVTDRSIMDIDRKPLGQDISRSAPLEQILSTGVEQNFWQRFLNYGNVIIRVGEAEFTFDGVVNPSMVQQEIFHRLSARKMQIEALEAGKERDRMVEWLRIYHEQVDKGRSADHEPDFY